MKTCPHCGGELHTKAMSGQTVKEVSDALTDKPKRIDQIAFEIGLSYFGVAPILKKLCDEGTAKRISARPAKGKRAVYHYVRQKETDTP